MRLQLVGCMGCSLSLPQATLPHISGPFANKPAAREQAPSRMIQARDRHVVLQRDASSGKAVLHDVEMDKAANRGGASSVHGDACATARGGYAYTTLQETMQYIRGHTGRA